jgi:hypothetical protein
MLSYLTHHLGVIGTALLALGIGYWALKTWSGKAFLALMVVFFMINDRLFSSSDLPIGGPAGDVVQIGQIGTQAQSGYELCLSKRINAEVASNPQLDAANRACATAKTAAVQQCLRAPKPSVLIADRPVYCDGQASPAWAQCLQAALINNSRDGPAAANDCRQGGVTSIMREVAGLFSFAKWWPTKEAATPTYNAECLRTAFNNNYRSLPQLHCDQVLGDAPKLQACIVQSLTQGFGAQGTALVAQCQNR